MFHPQETRVDGHWFITVLAYQFVQIIRRHLKEPGIAGRWDTLREILGSQCRVTATFRRADGRILQVRKATRPEGPRHLPGTEPQPRPGRDRQDDRLTGLSPLDDEHVVPLAIFLIGNLSINKGLFEGAVKMG